MHSTRRDSTARLALELLVVLLVLLLLQRPRGVTLRGGGAAPAARALISAGHGLLDLLGEHEAVRARLPLLRPLLDVLALLARAQDELVPAELLLRAAERSVTVELLRSLQDALEHPLSIHGQHELVRERRKIQRRVLLRKPVDH